MRFIDGTCMVQFCVLQILVKGKFCRPHACVCMEETGGRYLPVVDGRRHVILVKRER